LVVVQCKAKKLTSTLVGPTLTIIGYYYRKLFFREQESAIGEKKKLQKRKEKIIVDVNAIMLENRKKKKGTSLATPSKVIIKVSLRQEGDDDKLIVASNVVNKVIEVAIGEDQNLNNVDIEQTFEIEMLHEEVVEDYMVEEKPQMLEDNVVMIIDQQGNGYNNKRSHPIHC